MRFVIDLVCFLFAYRNTSTSASENMYIRLPIKAKKYHTSTLNHQIITL